MFSKIAAAAVLMATCTASAQAISFETLLSDKISIRAIEVDKGKVWYAGTDSKFGYVGLKTPSDKKQIRLSQEHLQFRTLAGDRHFYYTISIGSPALFFRVDKKTLQYSLVETDSEPRAFYDALLYHNGMFYTFSDPNEDLKLKFFSFNMLNDRFISGSSPQILLKAGEAAFAASNTNIAASQSYIWFATGGLSARIFRHHLGTGETEAIETPFVMGSNSKGIYSLDFYKDQFGIAVGGDYKKQDENLNNIATSTDGGRTWQIQASGRNAGYKTCVRIRPGSKGREIVALGDQNIEYSADFGKSWKKISDEKNLYTCRWAGKNTLIAAGKDRIIKMRIPQKP